MKYYIKNNTLIIEGKFEALSSGVNGGRSSIASIINHQVQPDFNHKQPAEYLNCLADTLNIPGPFFGLLTAVSMDNLCISTDDYLTAFVTAGVTHPSPFRIGTINIILVIKGALSEGAMVGAVITATEAKGLALLDLGFHFTGTTTDAIVVAYEKHPRYIEYSGTSTAFGEKIIKTVIRGVKESATKK
jgi:adenosylcobinamide hydrolase